MIDKKQQNIQPTIRESRWGKIIIFSGLIVSLNFIIWFTNPQFIGYKPLYYVIIIVFIYKIFLRYIEWFFCFHLSVKPKPESKKQWSVDVLTTFCAGEPKEMIIETLHAIKNIRYPHRSFLCDEANDLELKNLCQELDIVHVTREKKINAKAGNINNALNTVASGEICLILDPDHVPYPEFLDEVLPYFEDPEVGFVQVVQAYYNQSRTVIAKAAAQQTYQFYGPQMMGLNSLGAVPAIGANCTFRRTALDSIGGHAPGLTEDMHTAMLLHSKKWKSVYNPVIVAKGLVPWNYSGYCLQQLKWSRGSFDLLFHVLPRIWKNLTWKQLFYYISAPFFYLSGFISIIDFLIPIIVLFTGLVPIKISVFDFAKFYFPLFIASFAIRQFNQRWLLEKHEKGAFIFGGTLFKASWWANLLGFIYAIIGKKVPYIPTPKDCNSRETPIKLLIPNFCVIGLSVIAIIYGLSRDFNPFMIFMAALAAANILVLSLGSVMAMQHMIIAVHARFQNSFISKGSSTRNWVHAQKQRIFSFFQLAAVPLLVASFLLLILFNNFEKNKLEALKTKADPFEDIYIPNISGTNSQSIQDATQFVCDTFNYDSSLLAKTKDFSNRCMANNKMPFFVISFNYEQIKSFAYNDIDTLFNPLFFTLREKYSPVFFSIINCTPERDSSTKMLAQCLTKLTSTANACSFPNIAWVWHTNHPFSDANIAQNKYSISWLLISADSLKKIPKTVANKKSIRPILVCKNNIISVLKPSNNVPDEIDLTAFKPNSPQKTESRSLGAFFVKGVAYNSGHDWRDNNVNLPLTIEKLEHDFESINQMGANTIRRYSPTIYDRNILAVAKEKNLKVIYGFWFDSKIDFNTDHAKINEYKRQVLNFVEDNKDNRTILCWSIGNETWGLLKRHFGEPYLSLVRKKYIDMVSEIAQDVKKIDSIHPIFTMEEHTSHLSSAMYAFSHFAPAIDLYGVNSYYEPNISKLDSIMQSVVPNKKYLISEFGPKGYWHHPYNDYVSDSLLSEQNSYTKAAWMKKQWKSYIIENRKHAVGGVAFCWQDRFEGTATWFGITDLDGNKKASWYALRNCFSNMQQTADSFPIPQFTIIASHEILWAGRMTKVRAVTTTNIPRQNFNYKWIIYEEDSFRKIAETNFVKGQYEFMFKIPNITSKCRVYVYISDNKENVITESKPILISCF